MNRQKWFYDFFCFDEDISKNMCPHSKRLLGHCVSLVDDFADIVNYFTLEKVKTYEKSHKKCNLILAKIACPCSRPSQSFPKVSS